MVLEGRTDLSEVAVLDRAIEFFRRELGMQIASQARTAITFEGPDGVVTVNVDEEGPDSIVNLVTEGMEEPGTEFMHRVAQIVSG